MEMTNVVLDMLSVQLTERVSDCLNERLGSEKIDEKLNYTFGLRKKKILEDVKRNWSEHEQ